VWPPHRLRLYFYGGHKSIEAILPRISQADSLAAKEVRDDLMWQIGEAWLEAQKREYGSGKALAEEVGISYQTCRMAATVAKRYSKLYDRSCLAAKQSKSEDGPPEDERDILIAKGPKPEAPDVPQVPPKPNVSFDAFLSSPHGLYHLTTVSLITFRVLEDACRGHGAGGYDCTGGASG
jgi:hypothetical protein